MLTFSKDQSSCLKGIAILMMLFLHLFNKEEFFPLYTPLFYINGYPFEYCLARAMNPVGIFLFISGYGLFKSWIKKHYGVSAIFRRLLRLIVVYWLTLLVFVSLGSFINSEKYPGSIEDFFSNISALRTTYNGECWFLLPYIALSILSVYLFPLVKQLKWYITALVMLVLFYLEALLYGRIWNLIFENAFFLFACRTIEISCNFVLGAVVAKLSTENFSFHLSHGYWNKYLSVLVMLFLVAYCTLYGMPLAPIYFVLFTLLLVNIIPFNCSERRVCKPFMLLGMYSMPMWLIHTYYSKYLFTDFIYSFKYPILIFGVEVAVSYVSGIVFLKLSNRILACCNKFSYEMTLGSK